MSIPTPVPEGGIDPEPTTYLIIIRRELRTTTHSHFRLALLLVFLGIVFFSLLNLMRFVGRLTATPGSGTGVEKEGEGGDGAGRQRCRRTRAVAAWCRKYLGCVPVPFIGLCASELLIVVLYWATLLTLLFTDDPAPPKAYQGQRYVPWANLAGKMSMASIPFVVVLSSKGSLLHLLLGVDFIALQFLHRWAARLCLFFALLHGSAKLWMVRTFSSDHVKLGVAAFAVAMALLMTANRLLQRYAYEIFFAAHIVLVIALIVLTWLHEPAMRYWLMFAVIIWGTERLFRFLRLIYVNGLWRRRSRTERRSRVTILSSSVVRVEIPAPDFPDWGPGSFAILSVPFSTWWPQGHPFTIASAPSTSHLTLIFLIRARGGWTKTLLKLAEKGQPVPLLVEGPYGDMPSLVGRFDTIVLVAGGTGITWALSVLLALGAQADLGLMPARAVHLIWVVRGADALHWIGPEIRTALRLLPPSILSVTVFVSSGFSDLDVPRPFLDHHNIQLHRGRPSMPDVLGSIQRCAQGRTYVGCSGPEGLSEEVRRCVRGLIDPKAVWKGAAKGDIELHLELFGW